MKIIEPESCCFINIFEINDKQRAGFNMKLQGRKIITQGKYVK